MSADLLAAFGGGGQQSDAGQGNQGTNTAGTFRPHRSSPHITRRADTENQVFAYDTTPESLWQTGGDGNDVLFDADEATADDFGDFEEVAQTGPEGPDPAYRPLKTAASKPESTDQPDPLIDLLGLGDEPPSGSRQDISTIETTADRSQRDPGLDWPLESSAAFTEDDADAWGDFEAVTKPSGPKAQSTQHKTFPQTPSKASRTAAILSAPEPEDDWDVFEDNNPITQPMPPSKGAHPIASPPPRPSNVPPPFTLLSILPQTFTSLLPPNATPTTSAVVSTHHTTARILSGRSLRWKRDSILAQSTRIAAAGKPGGMKLTSLNKSEVAREDREAADVVAAWNDQLHFWQKMLTQAGKKVKGLRLSTDTKVGELRGAGVMEAKVVCALCGLKRNERTMGVDTEADDVFGEFWSEGWGHSECVEWWETWRGELNQR